MKEKMSATRKMLVVGAEPATVSQEPPPGDGDLRPDDELIQDRLLVTKKLCAVVRTFCRTAERERRIDLLAVMRQEARGLRETLSAAKFGALANFTSALERWFTALAKDVDAINGSTLKTVSHAIDFLTRAASSNSGHEEMARTPIRMLAVDDDPVCRRTLTVLDSNNNGVRLVTCDGAEPALLQLKSGDFDLILSDIQMPGKNGFEFVAEVRTLPKHRTTPVIFVSSLSDFETRKQSVLIGGCDLMAKPFTADEVLVKALTLGLERLFDSATAVAQVEGQRQEVPSNGASQDSELPSPNKGRNGHETSDRGSSTPRRLATSGVIFVEESGGIRSTNMGGIELLGYTPGEVANRDIRFLIPDELQSEENKTLLSQALAGTVKSKNGIKMTGRHKDNSTVQLLVAFSETWVGQQRSILCLLKLASPPVAAKEDVCAPAVEAKSARAELTSRIEQHDTTLAELVRSKKFWEACASERAALLEELRNRLRGQDSAVENLRRESESLKGLLKRQAEEHLERQSELKELIQAKKYWEDCASERAALIEALRNQLRGQDCTVEDLRRESESLKGFGATRLAELQQMRNLLERQTKEHLERQSELQCKCGTMQGQLDSLAESLAQTRAQFAAEQAALAERAQQEGQLKGECARLEQELARRKKTEEKLQSELQEKQAQLQTTNDNLSAQQSHLEGQSRELQAAQAALAERAQQEGQLKGECARLEQELARRKETEEKLQSELQEKQAQLQTTNDNLSAQQSHLEGQSRELQAAQVTLRELTAANEAVAKELSAARGQLQQEELQRQRLAAMVLEEQDAKAELRKQFQAMYESDKARQQTIAELEVEVQKNLRVLRTLELSLETQSVEQRSLHSRLESVEARLGEASRQLELKNAAEQCWRQREAELEAGVHRLHEQVISSAATMTIREGEIRSARARLEESLLIQSALCGKVKDLTARECSLAQCQTEMNEHLAMAQQKIDEGQKDLAALRYAVLDAQRLRLQIGRERLQGTRQHLDGLQEVTSVLLNTPLSMAQRGVVNSLKAALAGWIGDCGHSVGRETFPVETPNFQTSEFSLSEVAGSAFKLIADSAAQTNVKASTMIPGEVPDELYGDAGHIHQLITLLADSLLRFPNARTLAVRVLVNQELPAGAELNVLFSIESHVDLKEVCNNLARTIAGSCTWEAAQLGEVESGLAACWHLAKAMDGSLQFDTPGDKEASFRLAVPVGVVEPIRSAEAAAMAQPFSRLLRIPEPVESAASDTGQIMPD